MPDIWRGTVTEGGVRVYRPPVPEFVIEKVQVSAGGSVTLAPPRGTTIVLVIAGSGVLSTVSAGVWSRDMNTCACVSTYRHVRLHVQTRVWVRVYLCECTCVSARV